jgi:dephospho-CoA kinase
VVVVDVPPEVAVERLVTQRGLTEADARARIAKQIGREERIAKADRVIDNSGDLAALDAQIDELWEWLVSRDVGPGPA